MSKTKQVCLIIFLVAANMSGPLWGHGGYGGGSHYHGGGYHGHGGYYSRPSIGFYYGPAFGWPYYYPFYAAPYVYPPAVVTVPSSPPVYIQQGGEKYNASPPHQNYWYYCRNPDGYYPYVKECPGGWLPVAPQPTNP